MNSLMTKYINVNDKTLFIYVISQSYDQVAISHQMYLVT